MAYMIVFSESALKQLKKLDRELQERITAVLERIRLRPEVYVRKLVGEPGYRLRVGDYRVIVDLDKEHLLVLVIKIGHRKSIYK
ncbi:MAG: type II toxin-antitoxin system RelE/ParE family toxin [Candidatus Altiarchaeales archaeon]|nr:type II toxin-antitoxin system RelE/ParE family toxin [Candidatus Altiarchaeales archaeon]